MASSTRKEKVLNSISPAALVAIVAMNLFLIYLMYETLGNQTDILRHIENNTQIALTNQKIGLNVSAVNQDMLERIINVQQATNDTFTEVLKIASNNTSDLS